MLEILKSERELIEQFLETLRALPEVKAELGTQDFVGLDGKRGYDVQVDLSVADKSLPLFVAARKAIYPRDVRQVLWQIREFIHRRPAEKGGGQFVPLLVAESISPGAKELLRAERVGYYDSGGSFYLSADGAYFFIDKPPPKSLSRSMRSLFSGRRAQVLHGLLNRHQDWLGVTELAEQVNVSPATASQVLAELERLDWLVSRGQGPSKQRHLREPAALLDAWVNQLTSLRPLVLRRYFVPSTKADNLLARLGQVFAVHNVEYAITSETAAQCYAPFLSGISQIRCRLLAGSAADAAIGELGARVVSEGANLAIIETKSSGDLLFREQVGGIWMANAIQVYLDLLRGEGRAKELAEHLRKERIGY